MTPADAKRLLDAVREAEDEARHDRGRYNNGWCSHSEQRREDARRALTFRARDLALGLVAAGKEISRLRLIAPQPPPANEAGDLWADIIAREQDPELRALFAARREQGIAKYGRPLGVGNGRDFRADAIQEALDGLVYAEGLGHVLGAGRVRVCFRNALRELIAMAGEVSDG